MWMRLSPLCVAALTMLTPIDAHAAPRSHADSGWSHVFGNPQALPGVDGRVHALTVHDGRLVVVGAFLEAGGLATSGIATWGSTGWEQFGRGIGGGSAVRSAISYAGDLFIAGPFTSIDGVVASGMARWDGVEWHDVDRPLDAVWVMGTHQGTLVAADQDHIEMWNGSTWSAVPGVFVLEDFGPVVRGFLSDGDDLYVIGDFVEVGGIAANHIARWDGSTWHSLGDGLDNDPWSIVAYDGDVVVGGRFEHAGGVETGGIARWDGETWHGFESSIHNVGSVSIYDGSVVAAGVLVHPGGTFEYRLARWTGTSWEGGAFATGVSAMAVMDGELVVAGDFDRSAGVLLGNIGRWDGAAIGLQPLGPVTQGLGLNGNARALAELGGDVIVGGTFRFAGPEAVHGIARWNGESWDDMAGGMGAGAYPVASAMTIFDDELIVCCGSDFRGLVAWNGSDWREIGATATALAVDAGHLVAAGSFTEVGGIPARNVARWDGDAWSAMGSGLASPARVLQPYGGALYAGWLYNASDGGPVSNIARWDGVDWSELAYASGGFESVSSMTTYEGDLIVGGSFHEIDGVQALFVARWDGTSWSPIGELTGAYDATVYALTVHNGLLYAGGTIAGRVAAWDGSEWSAVGGGLTGDYGGSVSSLLSHGDELIVGGDFVLVGDYPHIPSFFIAAWTDTETPVLLSGFTARARAHRVDLDWQADPRGVRGFHVHRRLVGEPPRRMTSLPVLGGPTYAYSDEHVLPAREYGYLLETVYQNGHTEMVAGEVLVTTSVVSPSLMGPMPGPPVRVRFSLETAGPAAVRVFDVSGRLVRVVLDDELTRGDHILEWDGRDAAGRPSVSGVYYVTVDVPDRSVTERALIVR